MLNAPVTKPVPVAAATANRVLFLCTGNYYRSRFAEAVFNYHCERWQLGWRAISRGLAIHLAPPNSLSPAVRIGLRLRGIPVHHTGAEKQTVTAADLHNASVRIALKEAEHRPLIRSLLPGWEERVTYWDIHDMDIAFPMTVLPVLEKKVVRLIEELTSLTRSSETDHARISATK
jgi:protein-tyrosine phosphatase